MKLSRLIAYGLGAVAFAMAVFAYQEYQFIGFPDGFEGGWDWARKILFVLIILLSAISGVWLFCFGWFASDKSIGRVLRSTIVAYVTLMSLFLALDYYIAHLSGRGG